MQVDMILGLVPAEEMEEYWREQDEQNQAGDPGVHERSGLRVRTRRAGWLSRIPSPTSRRSSTPSSGGSASAPRWIPSRARSGEVDEYYEWPNQDIVDALSPSEADAWFEVSNRCSNDAYLEGDPYRNPMVQQAIEDFFTDVEQDPG